MEDKELLNDTRFEKCEVCGAVTDIPIDMPIQERKGYIEGAGQLCKKCYYELYVKRPR